MENRWTIGLAVVCAILCCILCGCQEKQSRKASVSAKNAASVQPERKIPGFGEYRYPNIPDKILTYFKKEPRNIVREANSRKEIVAGEDEYDYIQSIGDHMFLACNNIAFGGIAPYIFLYVNDGSRWRLIYMGNGGMSSSRGDYFKCAYFDYDKRAVCFEEKDGTLISTVKIGRELDLLKEKQSIKDSLSAKNVASAQPEHRTSVSMREYRYPNIPNRLRIGFEKEPRNILRKAKNVKEIVAWAKDCALVWYTADPLVVCENVGSGWCIFIYAYDNSSDLRLIYIGDGGLPPMLDYFKCIYFDSRKNTVCFEGKDGTLISTVKIGHELDLLKKKH